MQQNEMLVLASPSRNVPLVVVCIPGKRGLSGIRGPGAECGPSKRKKKGRRKICGGRRVAAATPVVRDKGIGAAVTGAAELRWRRKTKDVMRIR